MNNKKYRCITNTPVGEILLTGDEGALSGLWFMRQAHFPEKISEFSEEPNLDIFKETKSWLEIYFSGEKPSFIPETHFSGTAFRMSIWNKLKVIGYGQYVTYGDICREIEQETGKKCSARAVGGAVGHNPIGIIIPCHRVLGAGGKITGYAGGLDKKRVLLNLEKINYKD